MLRVPMLAVTTRHSVSLYPFQVSPGLGGGDPVIGLDRLAGGGVFGCDPWQLYAAGIITSPNMVVLGQLGTGKSALVKTYLHRQRRAGRWIGVLDPKGEYGPLAACAKLAHLVLRPGGPHRLNPLEVPAGPADPAGTARHRAGVTTALAACGLGRALAPEERAAIGAAAAGLPAEATLADLAGRLFAPDAVMSAALATSADRLAAAVRPAALELRRLLDGDLAGLLDGPSTVGPADVAAGLVVDLSAVFTSAALAPVMVGVTAWLTSLIAETAGPARILALDEAWALLSAPASTSWLQATAKLARSYGTQLILVTHRISDLSAQADAGSTAEKQAAGLLADTGIRVVHTQSAGERDAAARLLGLTPAETELITRLPAHRALWRLGGRTALVDHVLSDADLALVDTDTRMRS
ncbi:MAG: hypothetical protein ACYDAQ_01805 [Mycobacteriales bacterium]